MNKGQQLGSGINFLGLILFVIWFIVRNKISTTVSIIFAVIFLGLLAASLFIMIRASVQVQETPKDIIGQHNSKS
jgi:hypothetical protein